MDHSSEIEIIYDKQGNPHEVIDFNDDDEGSKLGFWFFLFTELMLFGGMFLVFTFYFYRYTDNFLEASATLNIVLGGINTFILLISTYFMGMGLINFKNGEVSKAKVKIVLTIVFSIIFLTVKYFEWMAEIHHGIYPDSDILNAKENGIILFFGLYFTMTGLHGVHIIIGIALMVWVILLMNRGTITTKKYVIFENVALYWDLVHMVWVFLFPLFYITGLGR